MAPEPARTLLLLRHAQTEDSRPGHDDRTRRLTDAGLEQARAVGKYLRSERILVSHALCSPADRARQTLDAMELGAQVEYLDRLYDAGSDTIIEAIRCLPDVVDTALVVGHAPGIPSVVHELADPETSTAEAAAAIESRFPAATLARLEVAGPWSEPAQVRLVAVRLPS